MALARLPVGHPRLPAGMRRADDPRAAGPWRLARSADRLSVDGLYVELGRTFVGGSGDGHGLADECLQRVLVAPIPGRTGGQIPGLPVRRERERRSTLAV